MNKKLSRWYKAWFWFNSGGATIDDDNYIEDGVIKYKDIYIQVLKGDTKWSIAWSYQPPDHYSIRDIKVVY